MTHSTVAKRTTGLARELASFALVGTAGFLTQAVLLTLLVRGLGVHPYPAWFPTFALAVLLTYLLNRRWTFRHRAGPRGTGRGGELARYALLQGLGALLNHAVYAAALWLHPLFRSQPVLALAAGSLVAMAGNYVAVRQLAFTAARPAGHDSRRSGGGAAGSQPEVAGHRAGWPAMTGRGEAGDCSPTPGTARRRASRASHDD